MASTSGSQEPKKSRFSRGSSVAKPKNEKSEPGVFAQFKQVFEMTRSNDPQAMAWVAGAFAVVFLLFLIVGFAIGHPIYLGLIGLLLGVAVALFVLGRRAKTAAYRQIEGQPGATGAVLTELRRGWRVEQEPVAAEMGRSRQVRDLSGAAMVFRAIGKPGVVLLAEGPRGSASKLLEAERRRTARVLGPEVPVHLMRVGNDSDATPVTEVTTAMNKLPKLLTDDEIEKVTKRLRALGPARPAVPAGVDPRKARVNRAAMRGR